jgi:sRNA-binding regulator protein Hfq
MAGSGQRQKKQTPAQRTFAYEYYLLKQIREKTPMVLKLVDGEEVSGMITWYDQYAIKLEREPEAPNLVVQKQAILYYYKKTKEEG